jgi:16S rRNA processing protein RimM
MSDDSLVEIAKIVRPHGIRGELRVQLYNHDSDILDQVDTIQARLADGTVRVLNIEACREVPGGARLLVIEGVGDRDGAEGLRGALLSVPRDALPPPDEGEFYVHDIMGAQVVLTDGTELGKVISHHAYPTTEVIVVQGASGRWEVPLVEDFVHSVDAKAGRVVLHSVEGLESE